MICFRGQHIDRDIVGKSIREDGCKRCQIKEVSWKIDGAIGRDRLPYRGVEATGEYDSVGESDTCKLPIYK